MRAEPVADTPHLALGEGPRWDATTRRLYWIGIKDRRLLTLDPSNGRVSGTGLDVTPGALMFRPDGRPVLATERGFELLDPADGRTTLLAPVEADQPERRMNDGACDPYGRPVAGTMQRSEPWRPGPLYRLEADGTARPVLDGLSVPNGLAWPEPDRLWHIDTPTRRIDLYEYPEHGPVGPRIRSLDVSHLPGLPDGMTLDAAGNLWVAFWGGAAVHCLSPAGHVLASVGLPAPRATSCTFGGPDLRTLYITTARTDEHPLSGALFALDGVGVGVGART
ncbi:SMP-30/gluconolactonase/LRE family protein [Kitasatospora sp. RG8]|uniref:SMP-30/gluconolactonase/LRE family protein n=1 Tax=Kitasatospora sp. RG8 TaxID=2820815 RepID=UPI001AE03C2A|nr:SMP-30/gluconolactonase/LRE family protein [Kitasatospora sp. RG8]MBP0448949.1 SMP-30/gluconolactonase/LRE family protein [Kitasatospora sp. RG8]